MGSKKSGSICAYLDVNRNRPGSFEVRLYLRSERFFPFVADDISPETGSVYKRPAPVTADRSCAHEVSFRLSERWDEAKDFWGKAVDGYKPVPKLARIC